MDHTNQEKVFCFGSTSTHIYKRGRYKFRKTFFARFIAGKKKNLKLRIVNYILYGNGKPIQGISNTNIELVRTCLVLKWNQDKKNSSIKEAYVYFVKV
ncbi:hypothetical protein NC651_026895 [Populus alba x Populus x berolinensis]|nr:hypothetical protein NC651_026895 [Populus alba x Populus x berolinensis]